MSKDFFAKLADFINGIHSNEDAPLSNSIDKRGELVNAIVSSLKSNYFGSKISLKDYSLLLFIDDNLFYSSVRTDDFKESVITTINYELGIELGSFEISPGPIPENDVTNIMECCYLRVRPNSSNTEISKAIIYPVNGNGAMCAEFVRLDSQKIQELPGQRYNIGAGTNPILADNSRRENQIAIDDNPSCSEFEKNKYVSRAHAHITYSKEYGFLLFAEHGGTRAAGKRTHIYRGSEKIELNNIISPAQLKDGDYIVLSKYVHLLFKIL